MDRIRKTAQEKNMEVYLFGGAVRDCLMGYSVNDLDFIVNGDALEFTKLLKKQHGDIFKFIFLKPKVKRAIAVTKNMNIDICPLTHDSKTVVGKDNIRKALIKNIQERDYTINSMLIKLDSDKNNNLLLKFKDFLGAKKSLKENELKYSDKNYFKKDPIQMLRGLRFRLKYGMKYTSDTKTLINEVSKCPKNKERLYYYRLFREYLKIAKDLFKIFFERLR